MALLEPIASENWGPDKARHLLNRAGFGLTHDRVQRLASLTPEAAVNELVDYESTSFDFPEPDFIEEPISRRELKQKYDAEGLDREAIQKRVQEQQRIERAAIEQLKGWWLERMYRTSRPLEEKMTLMWHGHFAVSSQKVKQSWATYDMNRTLRRFATGNFKALTTAVGQSPAMLDYLDNRKSTKHEPNENWARELMELFTLGQGHYTEQDIKESARSFTGWMCTQKDFVYDPKRHDFGQKTFMGKTGDFDGWQILDIIFEQPALAKFITGKMWRYFASESIAPDVNEALATIFRESNYELKPVLKAMFLSQEFYAPAVMGSQIKSPAQFLVQLCNDMGVDALPHRALALGCRQLGQDLFYPPNVKGWDGNRAWINANSLLIRYNAPPAIIGAAMKEAQKADTPAMTMQAAADSTMQAEASMRSEASMQETAKKSPDHGMAEWRKEAMAQAREKMKELPPDERRAKMQEFKAAKPGQKMRMLKELGIEPPAALLKDDPLHLFDKLKFSNGAECIAALEKKMLVAPLDPAQRATLLSTVGVSDPAAAMDPDSLDIDERRALLRLLSSTPQYQLC